ncbi:MAG: nucleoside hydrolase [Candidatus Hydrogenedens sp.]
MNKYLFLLLWLFSCSAMSLPQIILDTDIGDDIDDTWALMHLLGAGKVDLKLIVTACDNTETKVKLVARMLETVERTDIPIGKGVKTSNKDINQLSWIEKYSLDNYKGKIHEEGVKTMIEMIRSAQEPTILCVIGPMMNIAKALEMAPDIAQKARIVSMAGSVYIGYGGKNSRDCEYNICRDVESARKVFSAPWEITIIPLDTCGTIILKGDNYRKIEESQSPFAKVVIENYNIWTNRKHYPKDESSVLYDTLAGYCTWSEEAVEIKTLNLSIDKEGKTYPDDNGRPVRCALTWKNREQFENSLIEALINPVKP